MKFTSSSDGLFDIYEAVLDKKSLDDAANGNVRFCLFTSHAGSAEPCGVGFILDKRRDDYAYQRMVLELRNFHKLKIATRLFVVDRTLRDALFSADGSGLEAEYTGHYATSVTLIPKYGRPRIIYATDKGSYRAQKFRFVRLFDADCTGNPTSNGRGKLHV